MTSTRNWGRLIDWATLGCAAGACGTVVYLGSLNVGDLGDYLGFIGSAVGAIITVAAAARVQGLLDARRRRAAEYAAVAQVRRAVEDALAIHARAQPIFEIDAWKNADAARLAAEADQVRLTLDRLLNQPSLTDGAIYAGSGAIRLLEGVARSAAIFQEPDGVNFGARALADLEHVGNVVNAINMRLADVIIWQAREL